MFGYRTFKIFGALIIIALAPWAELTSIAIDLNWIIMLGCVVWIGFLVVLHRDYLAISRHQQLLFSADSIAK